MVTTLLPTWFMLMISVRQGGTFGLLFRLLLVTFWTAVVTSVLLNILRPTF